MLTRNSLRLPALTSPATPLLICLLALFAVAGAWSPLQAEDEKNEIRTWTSYEGTALTASYVSSDDKNVTLDRRNGSEPVTISIERLKFEDQVYVVALKALQTKPVTSVKWPDKIAVPAIEVTRKDERNFDTENFSFLCELATSEEFVKEAATYFEGTLAAVRALPFDLRANPPKGWQQFVVTLGERATFDNIVSTGPRPHPAQRLLAGYFGEHRQSFVPYDSIEGRTRDGLPGLKLNEDFGVLIHEITHQVGHNALTVLPYWFSEGLAEYMSVVPMKDGAFHFSRAETAARLKKVLKSRYQLSSPELMHPRDLMDPKQGKAWGNDAGGHVAALLTVYYLVHLQDPDAEGKSIADAVRLLRAVDDEAWRLLSEYNDAIEAATPIIEKFEKDRERFRKQVAAYNKRLDAVREGKPVLVEGGGGEGGRVVVGGGLGAPPVAPKMPTVPEILKHQRDRPLEVAGFSLPMAVNILRNGRSYQQFADDMKAAYAEIGIAVSIRPMEEKAPAAP